MSTTYRASVIAADGMLHTSRPLTAPDSVRDLVDAVVDRIVYGGEELLSVELVFGVAGESETPVGDGITSTTSAPLDAGHMTVDPAGPHAPDFDDDEPAVPTMSVPA